MEHDGTGITFGIVILVILAIIVGIAAILIAVFFSLSCYKTQKAVPEQYRQFPAWFCWMFLIPLAGYIFQWIMLPFGIPNSLRLYLESNHQAVRDAKTLFGLGLATVILPLLGWIPFVGIGSGIAALVLFIIYWVKVVQFRDRHLQKIIPQADQAQSTETKKPEEPGSES